jgi:HTH-type transcriptional regulator / antitoxin HigA
VLHIPHNDAEYERLIAILDQLIDQIGNDETHPLAPLMEVIGVLIEKYEDKHIPELDDL